MHSSVGAALLCSVTLVWACGSGSTASDQGAVKDTGHSAEDAVGPSTDAWDGGATDAWDGGEPDQGLSDVGFDDTGVVSDAGPSGIGPSGGTLQGPGGVEIIVPAGALTDFVEIAVATASATNPSFPPAGVEAAGPLVEVLPHGTSFALPVILRLPYEPALVPAGARVRLYRAQPGGSFAEIPSSTISGDRLEASVTSFSYFGPGAPPPPALRFSEVARRCARESLGGDVWCWGELGVIALDSGLAEPAPNNTVFREPTRLPPRALTSIVAGPGWVCGLDVLNLWCIGDAQLTRTAAPPETPPRREWVQKPLPAGVVLGELAGSGYFACGLGAANSPDPSAAGQVFCWGDNTVGQLGRDLLSNNWEVLPLNSPHRYVAIAAAGAFACAARSGSGEVDCWGSNIYGGVAPYSLGSFDMTATPIPRGITVAARSGAIAAGNVNACGLATDGTASCWGNNYEGQMGNGTSHPFGQNYRPPTEVPGIKFRSIWPGETMCGIALDGQTYCWGHASQGSLGNGQDDAGGPPATSNKQLTPALVAAPLGVSFESIAIGDTGRCAKSTSNEVYCWGTNGSFKLGIGADMPLWSNVPLPIKSYNLTRMMP